MVAPGRGYPSSSLTIPLIVMFSPITIGFTKLLSFMILIVFLMRTNLSFSCLEISKSTLNAFLSLIAAKVIKASKEFSKSLV